MKTTKSSWFSMFSPLEKMFLHSRKPGNMNSCQFVCLFGLFVMLIGKPASAQDYTLSPNLSGQGTVTSTDGQIKCTRNNSGLSGTCSASYASGTQVTMNATAATGWVFSGWSGALESGCNAGNPCVVVMTTNLSPTATFVVAQSYSLSPNLSGYGTVTSTDGEINCTRSATGLSGACSATYASGTQVTMDATAASGWTFSAWSSAADSTCNGGNPCVVTMNQNLSPTATFTSSTLSVSPSPLVAPNASAVNSTFTGHFFISGQNFPSNAFVTTDGPLVLTGTPTITPTLIVQEYEIGCCAPQQGQTFHLWVNTPPSASLEIADTITLSTTEPVFSLPVPSNGGWFWDATSTPPWSCPTTGCPTLSYAVLNPDLWNLSSASGSLSMAFSGALDTTISLSTIQLKNESTPIVGYPNLSYGWSPFSQSSWFQSPDFTLPQQVLSFPNVWSMVNYSISPTTKIDFTYDIWVTQPPAHSGICAGDVELMIWTYKDGLKPSSYTGAVLETFNGTQHPEQLLTWMGGSVQYPIWQAYVGQSGSGSASCGYGTTVSLVLKSPQVSGYIGVGLDQMIGAMIDTLVSCTPSKCDGTTWTQSNLEQYSVDSISLGSEFGPNNKSEAYYSYNISPGNVSEYCFVIAPSNDSTWSDYQCPAN
jgi:List-Bact-rpt repeat protein